MSETQITRCTNCRQAVFPERLRCPRCGGPEFDRIPAGPGTLEQTTTVHHPAAPAGEHVTVGSVRLDIGPMLVVRVALRVRAGARVIVAQSANGAFWARQS